jgi:hypothetical protein
VAIPARKLRVQPVFMYTTYQRREKTSWKSWSSINTPEAAKEEAARIARELAAMAAEADFAMEILPLATVTTAEEARRVHDKDYDVVLVYPATGGGNVFSACLPPKPDKDAIVFVRHRSGPVYYWYGPRRGGGRLRRGRLAFAGAIRLEELHRPADRRAGRSGREV